MYTLYYSPSACSLATQVVLHELGQEVEIINVDTVQNFKSINPVGAVPVLIDQNSNQRKVYTEGAAILLHLLNKYKNTLLPNNEDARNHAIEQILFANATMHPAYSRLFFIAQNITDETAKISAFEVAANMISNLWDVVEKQLIEQADKEKYLGGDQVSAADIMLTVYSRWGGNFPVNITIGKRTKQMINSVLAMPSFMRALAAEG